VLNGLFKSKDSGEKSSTPEVGTPVVVHCKEFRCLGYLDNDGKWRDFARSDELPEVIDWCDL